MTALGVLAPQVSVNGTDLPADWQEKLTGLRVDQAMNLVGRASLRFADRGYALSSQNIFALGGSVTIGLHTGATLMVGTVTGVSLEQRADDAPVLSIVVDDEGYKLTRATRVKTYLNASYGDVIRQIASSVGLSCTVGSGADSVQEYLLQSGTDLAFLESICARVGFSWWVGGSNGKQFFAEKPTATTGSVDAKLGEDLLEFSVQASGLRPNAVTVRGWDSNNQQNLMGQSSSGSGATATSRFVTDYLSSPGPLGSSPALARDANPVDASEATTAAQALYDDWSANSVVARGTGLVNANLQPGTMVRVSQAGPSSGSYRISAVEHIYTSHGFYTKFVAGRNRPAGLVDTLGPAKVDAGLSVAGLMVGIVTDNNDPDGLGRVKVKYAGDDEVGSPWARLVTLGAGANRGSIFMPEVNDEVLVGFEHGDTRRPVVLGGLYSKKNKLPDWGVADNKVAARRITSGAGHIFEFGDDSDPSKSHVLLKLAGGAHLLRLGADKFDLEVAGGKPITIKAGSAKFEITASGDVNIEGNNVNIKATQALNLQGGTTATVKGSTSAELSGMQVSVKGSATGTIDGGASLTVKGGMVAIN